MTDEERQKLCATLRRMPGMLNHDCSRAAREIERLEKEVARLKDEYGVLLERTTNMLDMTVR